MRKTTKAAWLAVPLAGFLLLAACGDDSGSSSATTGGSAATTAGGGAATTGGGAATTGAAGGDATSLASVCPATVVVQTARPARSWRRAGRTRASTPTRRS